MFSFFKGETNCHFLHAAGTFHFMLAAQIEGKDLICKSPVDQLY